MRKITYTALVFAFAAGSALAKPITPLTAKTVAENFYKRNSAIQLTSSTLAYTYTDANGQPVYYAYNINDKDGFVIISAEDAGKPIIGYSTERSFVAPEQGSPSNYWMGLRVKEIQSARERNASADKGTAALWNKYLQSASATAKTSDISTATVVVAPLVQTTWNQSPYYNALCPGSTGQGTNSAASVTGCVATTMSQIMRYWKWPAKGTGSSSYTQNPNPNGYPAQSANYGITTYNWSNMPLSVNSANNDVAVLNYQAGVSVKMNYAPSGSGANVLQSDVGVGGACAQRSYYTYFSYDPSLIKGFKRDNIGDAAFLSYITNDLDIGRPVQYAGWDPSEGGHTWVCDGYSMDDTATYVHMNWGWAGSDDGFFDINNLLTTNGGFNPSANHEVLVGIVPLAASALDASIQTVSSPSGAYCTNNFTPVVTLMNVGSTTMTSCTINYQIDGGSVQTINWTGNLVNHQSATVTLPSYVSTTGSHTLTCYSSSPNASTDGNAANDQATTTYNVSGTDILPIVESFENPSTVSSAWSMVEAPSASPAWATTTSAFATGSTSIMLSNLGNTTGNVSSFQTFSSYDLTTMSSPALSFKAAYQQTATSNTDKLQVLASTDCGATWTSKRSITSTSLAALSGGVSSTAYVPNAAQFTTYTVNIASLTSSTKVMFKWAFTAGSSVGNNAYIDDINILDASSGISKIENTMDLTIYPNPSLGSVNIAFGLTEKQTIAVNVVDMIGRVVETIPAKEYAAGDNNITIAQKTYQAGVYFVNITINGQNISKKIVIQ